MGFGDAQHTQVGCGHLTYEALFDRPLREVMRKCDSAVRHPTATFETSAGGCWRHTNGHVGAIQHKAYTTVLTTSAGMIGQ